MKQATTSAMVVLLGLFVGLCVFPAMVIFSPDALDAAWVRPMARICMVAILLGTPAMFFFSVRQRRREQREENLREAGIRSLPLMGRTSLASMVPRIALIAAMLIGGGVFIFS